MRKETMHGIREAMKNGASKAAVCRTFGVKRSTLSEALARETGNMCLRPPSALVILYTNAGPPPRRRALGHDSLAEWESAL